MRDLNISTMNILLMIAFTLINVILLVCKQTTTFLFSASFPTYLVAGAADLCGWFGDEYYATAYPDGAPEFLNISFFYVMIAVAAVIIALYVALWFLSRKKKVGAILLVVLYAIDTVFALITVDIPALIFHAWVMYYLIIGIKAFDGIRYAPTAEEVNAQIMAQYAQADPTEPTETPAEVVDAPVDTPTETPAEETTETPIE